MKRKSRLVAFLLCAVLLLQLVGCVDEKKVATPESEPTQIQVEIPEGPAGDWPTKQELFDGKCWTAPIGPLSGVIKFFADGTYIGYKFDIFGTKHTGTYTYQNGILVFANQVWDLEEYGFFTSRTPDTGGNSHFIAPGGEDDWNDYATRE